MIFPGTRDRLLDVAERLFAGKGFEATSLRDITSAAKANLAAVNYHFRSKEALIRAVFDRRFGQLTRERLAQLDRVEEGRLTTEGILRAFIAPTIALMKRAPYFMELMGRIQVQPDAELHEYLFRHCEELSRRFERALRSALPHVPVTDLYWRMHFVMGALTSTWTCHRDLERLSGGRVSTKDEESITRRLIAFGAAGLRAPAARKIRKAY